MFILLIAIVHAFEQIQVEQSQGHPIYLKQRTTEYQIKFKDEFTQTPQIALSISKLTINKADKYAFDVEAKQITVNGFTIVCEKYSDTDIQIQVQWIAIFDPRVQITYHTAVIGDKLIQVPVNSKNIFYSVIGFATTQPKLLTKLDTVQNGIATIRLNGKAEMVKICVVSSPGLHSQYVPFKTKANHPWISKRAGLSIINAEYAKLPEQKLMVGFIGFDFISTNMKLEVKSKSQSKVSVGTWNEALLKYAQVSILGYTEDKNIYFPDKKCVELFSQCHYQGDVVRLCDNGNAQHLKKQFTFRSFMIPEGKVFDLVSGQDTEQLEGAASCVDAIQLG